MQVTPFSFEQHQVRTVANHETGEVLFVGKDVCVALGYVDHTNAMKQHCRGVVNHHPIQDSMGRTQSVRVLTEADVLRLIVSSNLPKAQAFERWVFEEVLPSIRKTGAYNMAQPQQPPIGLVSKPDPQAFTVVQSAWVEAVERKIASKREALQFLRDASAVMIHGVEILQRAAKHKPAAKALQTPTQPALTIGESAPYELRAKGTKSATELLHTFGVPISAKALYDIMEKKNMVTTRYTPDANDSGYRVLIGDGLSYGQNVMQFESTRSTPYFYAAKFGALLVERIGPLADVAPKPTPEERALHQYKTIMREAWKSCGKPIDDNSGFPHVTRSALVEYLVGTMGKMQKTACNMAAPRGYMMRPLLDNGFVIHHGQGWLIVEATLASM